MHLHCIALNGRTNNKLRGGSGEGSRNHSTIPIRAWWNLENPTHSTSSWCSGQHLKLTPPRYNLKYYHFRIMGFLDFVHRLVCQRTQSVRNWICFCPYVKDCVISITLGHQSSNSDWLILVNLLPPTYLFSRGQTDQVSRTLCSVAYWMDMPETPVVVRR
jgi:hypothetical protein